MLEGFITSLSSDVRYYVKLDNPNTFEQAVARAQMVEQWLAEAVTDEVIHPISIPRPLKVKTTSPSSWWRRASRPVESCELLEVREQIKALTFPFGRISPLWPKPMRESAHC